MPCENCAKKESAYRFTYGDDTTKIFCIECAFRLMREGHQHRVKYIEALQNRDDEHTIEGQVGGA